MLTRFHPDPPILGQSLTAYNGAEPFTIISPQAFPDSARGWFSLIRLRGELSVYDSPSLSDPDLSYSSQSTRSSVRLSGRYRI
jgi:hypothetical protein